jgi:hypothetical protein
MLWIFKYFRRKKWRKIWLKIQNTMLWQKLTATLFSMKNANSFLRKLVKNAENRLYNIDPCTLLYELVSAVIYVQNSHLINVFISDLFNC